MFMGKVGSIDDVFMIWREQIYRIHDWKRFDWIRNGLYSLTDAIKWFCQVIQALSDWVLFGNGCRTSEEKDFEVRF